MEIFDQNQPPLPAGQDMRRQINIDTWTGLEASDACQNYTEKATVINVKDPWARKWLETGAGRNWLDDHNFSSPPVYAPERECTAGDPRPTLALSINDGETINQPTVVVTGSATASDKVRSWTLEFGLGNDPNNWTTLAQGDQPVNNAPFLNWDLTNLPNQVITLHLHMQGKNGYADRYVHFKLALPQPTDTPTPPAPTETPNPNTGPTETPVPPTETSTPAG